MKEPAIGHDRVKLTSMIEPTRWLLDTCFISELRKPKPDRGVDEWITENNPSQCYVSVISLLELERGASLLERRDARQATLLRIWLEQVISIEFARRTISITPDVALKAGRLAGHMSTAYNDTLIAATAIHHGLTVVTRNVRHFEPTGVSLVNPWAA